MTLLRTSAPPPRPRASLRAPAVAPVHACRSRRARGSVLILVVAALALLVLMGTAYIVSARTERASARAMSNAANVDLAQDAVMSIVQKTVGSADIDSSGAVGGYDTTGTNTNIVAGAPLGQAARYFDYPENGLDPAHGSGTFGKSTTGGGLVPDEPWLVASLHRHDSADHDLSQLSDGPFNPKIGAYDSSAAGTWQTFPPPTGTGPSQLNNVVGDQTTIDAVPLTKDSSADPPAVVSDSYINLLPYADASGVRYRFGIRIIDTNRMANLNTGDPVNTGTTSPDTTGTYLTSLKLTGTWPTPNAYFNTSDASTAASLQADPTGFGRVSSSDTTYASYPTGSLVPIAQWEQLAFQFEKPSDPLLSFYELADELELRSYGEFGTSYVPRAATTTVWPKTLGNMSGSTVVGNPSRRNYTTYSFSRELRGYKTPDNATTPSPTTVFTMVPSSDPINADTALPAGYTSTAAPWPSVALKATGSSAAPFYYNHAKISANPIVDISNVQGQDDAMYYIAASATNMASIMTYSGLTTAFNPDEARAFAVNYMTARWNGWAKDTKVGATTAYYLPNGPSFMDQAGICFRTASTNGAPLGRDFTGTLNSGTAGRVFLGNAAQPFINEIAAYEAQDTSATPTVTKITDSAVELVNPYPVAISLNGYRLQVSGAATSVDLSPGAGGPGFIPPHGYYIVTTTNGYYSAKLTAPSTAEFGYQVQVDDNIKLIYGGAASTVTLYRPYCPRGSTTIYPASSTTPVAPVDVADFTGLVKPDALPDINAGGTPADYDSARGNVSQSSLWGATNKDWVTIQAAGDTLGAYNNNSGSGEPLHDRFAEGTDAQGTPLSMFEFLEIMRVCNQFNDTAAVGTPWPTTWQSGSSEDQVITNELSQSTLTANSASAPYSGFIGGFKYDDQVHFDFYADAKYFNTVPPSDPTGTGHDFRAFQFLDQISLVDRASNYALNIGGGPDDINKLRIPGQINVNTASGDVLRALPAIQAATNPDQLVAEILAYRARKASGTVTYHSAQNAVDYSAIPGLGFRSLAELIVPLAATGANDVLTRDQVWGSIYNLCTVRSDTFAVYGYLEAVRQNPGYTNFTNDTATTGWYGTVTDDPHNTSAPLIRVSRRRWVAIIDRSWCNADRSSPAFTLPRVVAIKDLPQ